MMHVAHNNIPAIRHAGLSLLNRELGPAGMIRFLQQFESGHGDYTKDRHQWQDKQSVSDLLTLLKKKRLAE